jgi:crotonobetainyl-CoA:carnitine CoA-transferase CaiB-like acyl-CoA transferase
LPVRRIGSRHRSLVGEHTGKILAELGYDEDVVAALQWSAAI